MLFSFYRCGPWSPKRLHSLSKDRELVELHTTIQSCLYRNVTILFYISRQWQMHTTPSHSSRLWFINTLHTGRGRVSFSGETFFHRNHGCPLVSEWSSEVRAISWNERSLAVTSVLWSAELSYIYMLSNKCLQSICLGRTGHNSPGSIQGDMSH